MILEIDNIIMQQKFNKYNNTVQLDYNLKLNYVNITLYLLLT
jgi:hypothetical protein